MAQKLQRDAEHNLQSFGQAGFDIIAGDSTVVAEDGDWVAVTAVGDSATKCALITATGDNFTANGNAGGAKIKIASGQVIYGDFTRIEIAPNQAAKYLLAYRRVV
jgi:hypothetical protein